MNRRLRGVLGTAGTWGAGWAVVGLALAWVRGGALRSAGATAPMAFSRFVAVLTVQWAAFGVVAGVVFALALWYAGRGERSVDGLAPRRMAAWGALAGLALPLGLAAVLSFAGVAVPLVSLVTLLGTGGFFGAGTAAGALAAAQRAPARPGGRVESPAPRPPVA